MKKNILYLLLFVFLLSLYGCGENLYADLDNNGSQESKQDQLDFEFIGNNCAPVMDYYNRVDSTGATLSRDDTFKFLSAILYCGGFNIIGGIDMVAKTGSSDIYGVIAAMLGVSEVTADSLNAISPYYAKSVNICSIKNMLAKDNDTTLDKSMISICGFAGMVGAAVNVSSLISTIAGIEIPIEISADGLKQALEQVDVDAKIDEFLANSENETYIEDLSLALNTAFDNLDSMEELLGGSTDMIYEIKNSLIDETTNKVSEEKLKAYINNIKERQNNGSSNNGNGSYGNGQGNGGR